MLDLYRKLAFCLAEGFGLLEFQARNVPLYTQSKDERRLAMDTFDLEQKRKAPQNRFEAGLSKQDKINRRRERAVKIKQSGKRL